MRHKIFQICWLLLFLLFSLSLDASPMLVTHFFSHHSSHFFYSLRLYCLYNELIAARAFCFPNQNVDKQMGRKTKTHTENGNVNHICILFSCHVPLFSCALSSLDNIFRWNFLTNESLWMWKFHTWNASRRYFEKLPNCNLLKTMQFGCIVIFICR